MHLYIYIFISIYIYIYYLFIYVSERVLGADLLELRMASCHGPHVSILGGVVFHQSFLW